MSVTCTRKIKFDAGHRVFEHESKCRNMHGHEYVVEITAKKDDEDLDRLGRVIDFGVLKKVVGSWVDDHWDHGFLYYESDAEVKDALSRVKEQKSYALPYNPTAENIAKYLLHVICPRLLKDTGVKVIHVRVWETSNCFADAYLEKASFFTKVFRK